MINQKKSSAKKEEKKEEKWITPEEACKKLGIIHKKEFLYQGEKKIKRDN